MIYQDFIESKRQLSGNFGFDPIWMPDFLYPFQQSLVEWACNKGRAGIFADCGLGKTPMQLAWAENVVRKSGGNVLIIAPLAVSTQTVREGAKFGIEVTRSDDGTFKPGITVTNYERLHHFDATDFVGTVCDESSSIKAFHGKRRSEVTQFMAKQKYRLLATATAAPNDWIELGTSSEALGELNRTDMLARFFKNDEGSKVVTASAKWVGQNPDGRRDPGWRLKGHAAEPFWRWVSSWGRAVRRPSDLGDFNDARFTLPELIEQQHLIKANTLADGMLFEMAAIGLHEQREEARRTINERCEKVASLVNDTGKPAIVWCHLNAEGNTLAGMIPDGIEISGSDSIEKKEAAIVDFLDGGARVLISKPRIFGWGLNLQHCAHMTFFPSHSYEAYYQAVRRCWRFGQTDPVSVDIVTTDGGRNIMNNLRRKQMQADRMFDALIDSMNQSQRVERKEYQSIKAKVPVWASK